MHKVNYAAIDTAVNEMPEAFAGGAGGMDDLARIAEKEATQKRKFVPAASSQSLSTPQENSEAAFVPGEIDIDDFDVPPAKRRSTEEFNITQKDVPLAVFGDLKK